MDDYNQADIWTSVEKSLQLLAEDYGSTEVNGLITEVVRASGTAFWIAVLYANGIKEGYRLGESLNDIRMWLGKIPREVETVWFSILNQIDPDYIRDAMDLFECVYATDRSLTPQELLFVGGLSGYSGFEGIDELDEIITRTRGLLSIQRQKQQNDSSIEEGNEPVIVEFVHPILRRILADVDANHLPDSFRLNIPRAQKMLLESCVRCLQEFVPLYSAKWQHEIPTYDEEMIRPDSPSVIVLAPTNTMPMDMVEGFLDYAVASLFIHLEQVVSIDEEAFRTFLSMIETYRGVETEQNVQARLPLRLLDIWGHLQYFVNGTAIYGPSMSILHIFCRFDMVESTTWWLENNKPCDMITKCGQSTLHWAAFYGSEKVALKLLQRSFKDNIDSLVDKINKRIFERTKDRNSSERMKGQERKQIVVASLETWSKSERIFLSNSSDFEERTPLHLAVGQGLSSMASLLIDSREILKTLVQKRLIGEYEIDVVKEEEGGFSNNVVPLNVADRNGNTPLHLAAEFGHFPIVEFLVQSGADWKVENKKSQTPEDTAASKSIKMEFSSQIRSFKAIVRLLKATAFASLDLASSPSANSKFVDNLFEAIIVRIPRGENSSVQRNQVPVHELVNGLVNMYEDPTRSLSWVHLPANNVSTISWRLMMCHYG